MLAHSLEVQDRFIVILSGIIPVIPKLFVYTLTSYVRRLQVFTYFNPISLTEVTGVRDHNPLYSQRLMLFNIVLTMLHY